MRESAESHAAIGEPSAWVRHWASRVPESGAVLDVACGSGRHARFFADLGHPVDAVDSNPDCISALSAVAGVHALRADIENGPWPYTGRQFAGVVVTNYLHRPLFPRLLESVSPGGVLIYETFAVGNEAYGRPKNPDFLLKPGELRAVISNDWLVLGYEHGLMTLPKPAVIQRICVMAPPLEN